MSQFTGKGRELHKQRQNPIVRNSRFDFHLHFLTFLTYSGTFEVALSRAQK
jgi:hypothetical protein